MHKPDFYWRLHPCNCLFVLNWFFFPLSVWHGVWCLLQSKWNAALRQHRSRFPLPSMSKALQGHTAFWYGCGGCKDEQTGDRNYSCSMAFKQGFWKSENQMCYRNRYNSSTFSCRQIFRSSHVNFCMSDPNLWIMEAAAYVIYKPHSCREGLHSVGCKAVGHHT